MRRAASTLRFAARREASSASARRVVSGSASRARVGTARRARARAASMRARVDGGGGGERVADARGEETRGEGASASEGGKKQKRDPAASLGVTGMRNFTLRHGALLMTEASAFADLNLQEASKKVRGVRVRQHVNPLTKRFQTQAPAPAWREVYRDAGKPLTIDVGCAGGRFDLLYAKRNPDKNVLGLDIREPLVERGLSWGEASGVVDNVHFATCNATVSIGEWIKSYHETSGATVDLVTILHPDPHFKTKHKKRRIVQATMVRQLAREMRPGARVYLQSDVEELTEDMREKFERFSDGCFDLDHELYDVDDVRAKATAAANEPVDDIDSDDDDGWRSTWVHGGWLSENPIGIPSEREVQTLGEGLPVYRVMLRRTEKACAN